jgi:hypothetical protein
MDATDQHFTVDSVFGAVPVRMDGPAIQVLLAHSRLRDAGTAIAAHRTLIDHIAVLKFEAGEVEDDGEVAISVADLTD